MPFGWKVVPNVYRSGADKKCVVWLYPYRSYDIVGKLKYWTKHRKNRKDRLSDLTKIDLINDDASLVAKIMDATARPKVIRDVAAEFTNKILGVSYFYTALTETLEKIFWKFQFRKMSGELYFLWPRDPMTRIFLKAPVIKFVRILTSVLFWDKITSLYQFYFFII